MSRAGGRYRCRFPWRRCFSEFDYRSSFTEVELLAGHYRGWSLTEIKSLSIRERRHWLRRAAWDIERR